MPAADNTEELVGLLDGIEGRRYAVVDAAHFDNLQDLLTKAGLPFHPLYLDEKDPAPGAEIAGPHLVELPTRASARKLIALADDKPAIVWWVWPEHGDATTTEIYRHLRRLNVVEIPSDRFDADEHPPAATDIGLINQVDHGHEHAPQPPKTESYDLVIFRHADPNAIAMLLPLLDAPQVSRLFGDAMGIVVDTEFESVRFFLRPAALPPKSKGWLRVTPDQYEAIGDNELHNSRLSISKYLRTVAEEETKNMSNSELYSHVKFAENTSKDYNFQTEYALGLWAFLLLITGGSLVGSPEIANYFQEHDDAPDDAMEHLLEDIAEMDDDEMERYLA